MNSKKDNMVRCIRCQGRKKLYKMMGGYSFTNCGGELVTCPMCAGKGEIKNFNFESEEVTKEVVRRVRSKKKEILDESEDKESSAGREDLHDGETVEVFSRTSEENL
jgi:hypothetical protein